MSYGFGSETVRDAPCPACGHQIAVAMFEDRQPLSTLLSPPSELEARAMQMLPLEFVRCLDCGHFFNVAFDPARLPSGRRMASIPERIGSERRDELITLLLAAMPENPSVVEVGHGRGLLLDAIARREPGGVYRCCDGAGRPPRRGTSAVEFIAGGFDPLQHLGEWEPHLLVLRHCLEYMRYPLAFLQRLVYASADSGVSCLAYIEVGSAERLLETARDVDFTYDQPSMFTARSFGRLLTNAGLELLEMDTLQEEEILIAVTRIEGNPVQRKRARVAEAYRAAVERSRYTIGRQLGEMREKMQSVALWGSSGPAVNFINRHHLSNALYPLVVDDDSERLHCAVPGTGQMVYPVSYLKQHPTDVLIVPQQCLAPHVAELLDAEGIDIGCLMIEHSGRLIDYHRDEHPYFPDDSFELSF